MKKIILASVLAVVATGAYATAGTASTVCAGTAGTGTSVVSAATNFVKTGFSPKCSANVHLAGEDGANYYRVGSTNTKGARAWMGSTAGGAVASTACANTAACTASDATGAATSASNPSS